MPDPKPDPSTPSSERTAMDKAWTLISDVLAGAEAVRAKGSIYLPKYEDESQPEYDRRKATAPWRPEFADALRALASKPFDQDVAIQGDVSETIKELAENIDGRGNSLTRFAAEVFEKGIAKGLHGIMVDFPTMEPGATRAQEQAAGARPYWIQVPGDDMIALYTTWVGGVEVVSHFRFRQCVVERDGFKEREVHRIRVYEPGRWEVWEQDPKTKDWTKPEGGEGLIARGSSQVASVPLVVLYTGERLGELRVKPPLADLGVMQVELYQALSRQDEVLTFAGSPMLAAEGMQAPTDGSAVAVGPKRILYAPPGGEGVTPRWGFIQPDAANISEIRTHVQSIVADMRRLGMQPATRQTGTPTATGESIEAAKAHSAVEAWAMALKDAIEQAFVFTCEWLNEPATVEVMVNTDFDVMPFAQAPLQALATARAAKDISQRTYWNGLRRFDVLQQDFDPEAEEEALAEEQQGLEAEAPIDPRTGAPIGGDDTADVMPGDLVSLFDPSLLGERP